MILIPYKADLELNRPPIVTLLLCILCLFVFFKQQGSYQIHEQSVRSFCSQEIKPSTLRVLRHITGQAQGVPCYGLFYHIQRADNPEQTMQSLVEQAKPLGVFDSRVAETSYMLDILKRRYQAFETATVKNLTDELAYNPNEVRLKTMLTSIVSHAGWAHLLGNLVFFFAFAASVELITGSVSFLVIILFTSVTTGIAYTFGIVGVPGQNIPTVGLSGIVFSMVALLGVLIPSLKIRCFFWFLVYIRIFRLPALLLAAWFIGWEVYHLKMNDGSSNVNFIAHVSGAATGLVIGLFYRLLRNDYLKALH